jgi:hypothetical protein
VLNVASAGRENGRRRGFRGALAALAALGLVVVGAAAARDIEEVNASMGSREICRNLSQVSLRKLRPGAPAQDRSATHARMQSDLAAPPATAPVVLRLLVGGGMGARGPAGLESVVAWRDASGGWFAQRAEEVPPDPSNGPEVPLAPIWPEVAPKPLIEGHLREPGGLRLSSGPLPAAQGALLDRALREDSCLGLEPATLPPSIPLRGGGSEACVPDAAWRDLEIRRGDRLQRFSRACRSIGAVGLIGDVLDGAALPGAPVYRGRADLYDGTDHPTAPPLRAFLAARLPGLRYRDADGEASITAVHERAPCEMALSLRGAAGATREVALPLVARGRSYRAWIDDGVIALGEGGADPSLIAPGTVLALQVQGTLFHLPHLCAAQP